MTTRDCDSCHRQQSWLPIVFSHTSAGYPGDHSGRLDCRECHSGGAETIPWPAPGYQPDCAGCHARDFEPDSHKKVDSPKILYSVSELRDCTGACHMYEDSSFSRIKKTRTSEHRVRDSEF